MAAPLVKTKTPGIFKRGSRYVFSYRVDGKQRWESCRTLAEARAAKAKRTAEAAGGEEMENRTITLHEYVLGAPGEEQDGWIERYRGNGKRGLREETRAEYRGLLDKYALTYFPRGTKLVDVSPRRIDMFIGWLCKRPNGRGGTLSDKSVRNALGPLMASLASAKREGLIRSNPAVGAALPHRPEIEDDEDQPRPFPGDTMELVVQLINPAFRLMLELLAATGIRRSELIGLAVRHLSLDGDRPHIKLRQRARFQKGEGMVIGPLKSRHARRELPIPIELADKLRTHVAGRDPDGLVFESPQGGPYYPQYLQNQLGPACEEAGVEWAGFHTFRHTVASRLFAAGRNAVQVQRWLGHHSAAFTLATYVHLLDDDLGEPLGPLSANKVQTDPTPLDATCGLAERPEGADLQPVLGAHATG